MAQNLVKVRSSDLRKKSGSAGSAKQPSSLTKTDLIRSLPSTLSPAEIVAEAKRRGVALSANLVSLVRGRDRRNPGPPRRRGRPRKHPSPAGASRGAPHVPTSKKARSPGAPLTPRERELAAVLMEIGLDRVLELVGQLKRALDAV